MGNHWMSWYGRWGTYQGELVWLCRRMWCKQHITKHKGSQCVLHRLLSTVEPVLSENPFEQLVSDGRWSNMQEFFKTGLTSHSNVTNKSTARCRINTTSPQKGSAKWMQKIWDAHRKFQNHHAGLEVSLCTKFQVDSSCKLWNCGAESDFWLFGSDPRILDGCPKMNSHLALPLTSVCLYQVWSWQL